MAGHLERQLAVRSLQPCTQGEANFIASHREAQAACIDPQQVRRSEHHRRRQWAGSDSHDDAGPSCKSHPAQAEGGKSGIENFENFGLGEKIGVSDNIYAYFYTFIFIGDFIYIDYIIVWGDFIGIWGGIDLYIGFIFEWGSFCVYIGFVFKWGSFCAYSFSHVNHTSEEDMRHLAEEDAACRNVWSS